MAKPDKVFLLRVWRQLFALSYYEIQRMEKCYSIQFQFKGLFIVYPHILQTYKGRTLTLLLQGPIGLINEIIMVTLICETQWYFKQEIVHTRLLKHVKFI